MQNGTSFKISGKLCVICPYYWFDGCIQVGAILYGHDWGAQKLTQNYLIAIQV
jgi:hypothetical protein